MIVSMPTPRGSILDLRSDEMSSSRALSARDADSASLLGKYANKRGRIYIWNANEIESVLSKQDAAVFDMPMESNQAETFPRNQDIRGELHGKNVIYEANSTDDKAKRFSLPVQTNRRKAPAGRKELLEARYHRRSSLSTIRLLKPGKYDDLRSGRGIARLSMSPLLEARKPRQSFSIRIFMIRGGASWRSYRAGGPSVDGFLTEYTELLSGLLDLLPGRIRRSMGEMGRSLQRNRPAFGDTNDGGDFDAGKFDSLRC